MSFLKLIRKISVSELREYFSNKMFALNEEDAKGTTPLLAAIASNRPAIVSTLLEMGANPNYTTAAATLPLVFSIDTIVDIDDYDSDEATKSAIEIMHLLIRFGASLKVVDVQENQNASEYAKGRLPDAANIFTQSTEK